MGQWELLYLRRVTTLSCGCRRIKSCILKARQKIWRCISSAYTSLGLAFILFSPSNCPSQIMGGICWCQGQAIQNELVSFCYQKSWADLLDHFRWGWEEVGSIYITQPHISYVGSLPLLQLGQIKDFKGFCLFKEHERRSGLWGAAFFSLSFFFK